MRSLGERVFFWLWFGRGLEGGGGSGCVLESGIDFSVYFALGEGFSVGRRCICTVG